MAQVWVYGDSLRDYCVSFVVLDPERMKKYCAEKGGEFNEAILENKELKQAVYDSLVALAA